MSRNNNQTEQNIKALDKPKDEDDIFKKMLEFRFDQPLTDKLVFEENDDLDNFNEEEAIRTVSSEDCTSKKSPGSNNKIILGTKKISRKSKKNQCKRKKCDVDNPEPNKATHVQMKNTSHLRLNEMVSITLKNSEDFFPDNNHSKSEESLNSIPSINFFSEERDATLKNLNLHDGTENSNTLMSTRSNDSEIMKSTDTVTVMKTKVQDNTCFSYNSEKYPIKPTDTVSALNSTSNSGQENLARVAIDEVKLKYKSFPRTKVTSRRNIKKFPGKMAAMKKIIDKTTVPTRCSSLGTIEDIVNAMPHAPSKPEPSVVTNSTINVQTSETKDINKKLQFQKNLYDIQYQQQRSMSPESNHQGNIGVTTSKPTQNEDLPNQKNVYNPRYETLKTVQRSMRPEWNHQENIGVTTPNPTQKENFPNQKNVYDPCLEALKTVADSLLVVFPYLNQYLGLKKCQAQNKEAILNAQKCFYGAKIQSFGLSYSTVVSFILPYKDNPQYMHEFYALVMERCREKKMQDPSLINLKILCSEMIGWIENKKIEIDSFNTDFCTMQSVESSNLVSDKNAPVRNQQLAQLLSTTSNIPPSNAGNINTTAKFSKAKARPSSLRFSAGPPGREIQISYDANVHHPLSSPIVQPNQKTTCKMQYRNQWTIPVVTPNVTVTASSHQPPWLTHNPSHNQCTSATTVPRHPQQNMPLPTQTYPQVFETFCSSREASLRPPPPTYEQIQRELQIQQQNHQSEESTYNARPSVIQERSSVSRDSGFMSPVGDNSAVEQMDYDLPADDVGLSPMITHVTSMNPKATYTPYSKCHVCGTTTNLRCIGCNRIYYCRPQCQGYDWGTHRQFCHK